jgi:hypothetical protein
MMPEDERGTDTLLTIKDEIRRRAREIFLRSGSRPGHDWDNWFRAEDEVRRECEAIIQESWADWAKKQHLFQESTWSHVSAFSCSSLDTDN